MIAHSATPILSDLLHKKIVKLLWKSFEIFGYVLRQLSVIFGQLSLLFKLLYVYRNLYLPTTVMTYIVVFVWKKRLKDEFKLNENDHLVNQHEAKEFFTFIIT